MRSLFYLLFGLLLFADLPAHAQSGCVPNPNLNGPPFVDGCPLPASALNRAFSAVPRGWVDATYYGATCGTGDSTAALQTAVNAVNTAGGGIVSIACPITVSGSVSIPGGVRLSGVGSAYYYGQTSGTNLWPPTSSPAINCTGTTNPCIVANGIGIEIDHINFGNPQPTPPASGTWVPTVYPFIIATTSTSGWQGLFLHDLTFTSTSKAIDLEGTPDYTTYSGSQIKIRDIWCNACLNTGIRIHRIDNPLFVDHVEFTPSWNFSVASMGAYLRANLIGLDIQYAAAPQFSNIDFFSTKSAIQLTNDTVTNNFGTLNFAISAGQFTNVQFNQVCQAVTMPNGNGTSTPGQVAFSNIYVWGDQSGFACSAGKPMFQLTSNYVNFTFSQLGVAQVDTFAAIGCGVAGTGSCPAGVSAPGGAELRINDADVLAYSAFTAGQPFVSAPSNAAVVFGATYLAGIRPAAGAGKIMGPGLDGTQAYMAPIFVGGGTNDLEGATGVQGSLNAPPGASTPGSGFITFFTPDHAENGWVGGCVDTGAASTQGCSLTATTGNIFLKPNATGTAPTLMSFGTASGKSIVNLGSLPTSCSGLATGTLWLNGANLQTCP